ncbi:hypothetical protein [Natronococcus occultus]|uniref:Uncharacterized protein n=1 Tax=Natronococcus occultus SP4 TaxID=694430 RepID=L0K078_9EURY|nr:hypothetical protein [Natronococcus occultus]AGB38702.1 hypothetical protein Natoc_2947 [Natronococcus occultus SP4]
MIADDTVVVTYSTPGPEGGDSVVGFDLRDGTERWRFEFEDDESWSDGADAGFLVVEDDTIYTQRGDDLVALRPDGWEESGSENEDDTDGESGNDDSEDGYEPGEDDGEASDDADGDSDDETDADDETGSGNGDEANGGDDGADDDTDDADGMPGFTAGAGIAGGALGLEWLRRRADDEADLEE